MKKNTPITPSANIFQPPAQSVIKPEEQRECNACDWKGITYRMLGSIGPLCPRCGETTEIATPVATISTPQEPAAPGEPVAWMDPSAGCVMDAFLWQRDVANPQYHVPVYTVPVAATAPVDAQTEAARDVLAERRRQVEQEGYEPDHDDEHKSEEIAAYAAYYAMPPGVREWPAVETGYADTFGEAIVPDGWNPTPPGDRRRELVKAGALILAEIERLDRAAMAATQLAGGQT